MIKVANGFVFGLDASRYTQNIKKGNNIAREEIQAGCCLIDTYVYSDPCLPFGGIKESGYGRELSYYGIKEFVHIKTVYVKLDFD